MRPQTVESFWAKVDTSGECWTWTRGRDKNGYGRCRWAGRYIRAHRLAYMLTFGPIPDGMFVCHACDNPSCVRPDHLWVGTNSDNMLDSVSKLRHSMARKQSCPRGHPYTGDNIAPNGPGRKCCRTCRREQERRRNRVRR